MKRIILLFALLTALACDAAAQGSVYFRTFIPTRLGAADGPIAGPGIWGQLLAGPTPDGLTPVGMAANHNIAGVVSGVGDVVVPTVPCNAAGFAQMVAWDGRLWGTVLANVPPDQLGYTDVVLTSMACFPSPAPSPPFTLPAIVPIPEPSIMALSGVGLGVGCLLARTSRRRARA